jgi:hypothetical protein
VISGDLRGLVGKRELSGLARWLAGLIRRVISPHLFLLSRFRLHRALLFLLETVLLFARDTVLLSHVSLHKDGT